MNNTVCLGTTKSGGSCRAKAGSSGYCPMHDPTKIAEREKEQKAKEAAEQIAQARSGRLREVIDVIKATCKGKGWTANIQHFDYEAGRHASLEVRRSFSKENYASETVVGTFDVTLTHKGTGVRVALHGTSFHSYGLKNLYNTIELDLERFVPWLETSKKLTQVIAPNALQQLDLLLRRFHRAAYQLTQRHDNKAPFLIENEYDVQDLLHALLLTLFDDVRPEDPVAAHAGKASRLDFLLKKEKIVVEAKMTRKNLRDGGVGEQLIIDIKRYQAHSDCQTLVCFVYDPGHYLKNAKALETDLSRKHDNLAVKVIIYSP